MVVSRCRPSRYGRHHIFRALVVLTLAAASISTSAANAASTGANVVEVPINVSPFDECTGEFVDLHGSLREVFMTSTDAAGGEHRIEIILYGQLTGTGELSGNSYRFLTAAPGVIQRPSSGA